MTESGSQGPPTSAGDPNRTHRTGLVTVLFTDMVGSTALKQRLGDRASSAFFDQHHQIVREILALFASGQEIETAGDSFLITFDTPSDAVKFALLLQSRMRALSLEQTTGALDRIGIYVGEVVIKEDQVSARPRDLYGIPIDICARIMSLAAGGQTLMSRFAFDTARPMLRGEELGDLQWLNHGAYQLKGIDEPIEVCEVRPAGSATAPPTTNDKASRLSTNGDLVLGWRPALEQLVPGTRWKLIEKLGEGGFGEVWLGHHEVLKEKRVFKFCFQAERVRSLKRELTLFRLLKEKVGEHPNIAAIREVNFDTAPFYIEMDYVAGQDLKAWCEGQGGAAQVPERVKLEVVAQIADALQAAHECGIVHRDVKPGNILISDCRSASSDFPGTDPKSKIQNLKVVAKLTDFGIGQVLSEEYLAGVTRAGFTQTMISPGTSSQTGTQIYMAPELLAGKPASTRSDIYSLGVVLYQLLVGDLRRPVTTDWAEDISDPLLREDLKHCFAGNPQDRFAGAAQLAKHLRSLPQRREELIRQQAELAAREKAAYRRGTYRAAGIAALILAVMAVLVVVALKKSRNARGEAIRADQQAQRADEQARRAEKNSAESHRRLVRMTVANGAKLLDENDYFGSLPFFVEALRLEEEKIPASEQTHRIRLESILKQSPVLLQVFLHKEAITGLQVSRDGRRLITASADNMVRIWDLATGAQVIPPLRHNGPVHAVALSSDGRRVATGSDDFTARVWDATTGEPISPAMEHNGAVKSVAFSPDGRRVATSGFEFMVKVWDATNGQQVLPPLQHQNFVIQVVFSPDGSHIATAGMDKAARIWNATSGKVIEPSLTHRGSVTHVEFSFDGRRLLTASSDGTARVWDAITGEPISPFLKHDAFLMHAAFSSDGRRVVTASGDFTARVWDATSGEALTPPIKHSSQVFFAAFSPDGRQFATASWDGRARIWDAATGQPTSPPLAHNGIFVMRSVFTPDGTRLVTAGDDQTVRLWDLTRGNFGEPPLGRDELSTTSLFSPGGNSLAVAQGNTVQIQNEATGQTNFPPILLGDQVAFASTFWLWNQLTSGSPGYLFQFAFQSDNYPANFFSFSDDGRCFVIANRQNSTVQVRDAITGKEVTPPLLHSNAVISAALSFDNTRLISIGGRRAQVWDVSKKQPLFPAVDQDADLVLATFSRDGRHFLTASGQTAKVWDADTGQLICTTPEHKGFITYAQFDRAGLRIVTCSSDETLEGREAFVCDARTGKLLVPALRHSDGVMFAAFSPDGSKIVTASEDQTARIWASATGRPLTAPLKHHQRVFHASFSPDNLFVVTASDDKTARVWDAATGEPVTPPLKHSEVVRRAEFASDGRHVITLSGSDQQLGRLQLSVRKWELAKDTRPVEDLVRLAQLLSCGELNAGGGVTSLDPGALTNLWLTLPGKYPAQFGAPTSEQILAWHRRQAEESESSRQWSATLFHLNFLIEADPNQAQLRVRRAEAYAELEDWKQAAADYSHAIENAGEKSSASQSSAWLGSLAGIQWGMNDFSGYRATCAQLVNRFPQTEDPQIAFLVVWNGVRVPDAGPNATNLLALAEIAATKQTNHYNYDLARAAALYRAGRFDEALQRLNEAMTAQKEDGAGYLFVFLALTHDRLGHEEEARQWLEKAAKVITENTASGSTAGGASGLNWQLRLERERLLREAQNLIGRKKE